MDHRASEPASAIIGHPAATTTQLEPGWLMRTCHYAHMRVMLDNSPSPYIPTKPPIPDQEAAELYGLMAARFEAWTGKPLADFVPRDSTIT